MLYRIKIKSSQLPTYWYASQNGTEHLAILRYDSNFCVVEPYNCVTIIPKPRYVSGEDAEIIEKVDAKLVYSCEIIMNSEN
jgi:hypothetical protein